MCFGQQNYILNEITGKLFLDRLGETHGIGLVGGDWSLKHQPRDSQQGYQGPQNR